VTFMGSVRFVALVLGQVPVSTKSCQGGHQVGTDEKTLAPVGGTLAVRAQRPDLASARAALDHPLLDQGRLMLLHHAAGGLSSAGTTLP